ncbi:MCE family protein [Hoyosella altamirensis]|uniref:Phospholipid/cholesterol/gamma-HCH transport system substrate-binding protein n=1 Tax=Hoyosella altamirensis TaxID=616997 RepID=A0A839RNB9_9ACTN|nr:MlaD family protein [Hoyosella altamirensis]MBB3037688.1 phospholipid/cholesterol/gamma-HCH transport system substrate-binding protein [Hoyosella altamirensis]
MTDTASVSGKIGRIIAIVLIVVLVAVTVWVVFLRDASKTIVAEFQVATGLYVDNEVRLLGVDVGNIAELEPTERGVLVTMKVNPDVDLPENIGAFITNRTLVADRYVEIVLPPRGERVGEFPDGGVIPLERTDVPIDYDMLLTSAKDLAERLSDQEELGGVRETVERMGQAFEGIGPEANRAIEQFAGATRVLGDNADEIDELLEVFGNIARMISSRDAEIREFTTSLTALAAEAGRQDIDLGSMISRIRVMFDEADRVVTERGGELSDIIASTDVLANTLANSPSDLAEILDVLPLIGQNVDRAIIDNHMRIRLNISTDLQQLPGLAPLCGDLGAALCTGAGLTNPISIPPSASDPFGLGAILQNSVRGGR